jgi:GT2 family glycosyltransferase
VSGFDENMAVGFGDVDLCLRIGQAGYRCIYSPDSSLVHHESLTRGKDGGDPHPNDTVFFKSRWKDLLATGDPFYHPAYSSYSFSWHYADTLPCSIHPAVRVWRRTAF